MFCTKTEPKFSCPLRDWYMNINVDIIVIQRILARLTGVSIQNFIKNMLDLEYKKFILVILDLYTKLNVYFLSL